MKGCKNCPAYGKCEVTYRSSACEELRASYEVHSDPEVVTNADKIRSMTDEELAKILLRYEGTEKRITPYGGHEHIFLSPNGEKCGTRDYALQLWIDWLKQPAKDD